MLSSFFLIKKAKVVLNSQDRTQIYIHPIETSLKQIWWIRFEAEQGHVRCFCSKSETILGMHRQDLPSIQRTPTALESKGLATFCSKQEENWMRHVYNYDDGSGSWSEDHHLGEGTIPYFSYDSAQPKLFYKRCWNRQRSRHQRLYKQTDPVRLC